MEDDCDIIIIGAGIAGTACALRCARAGLSVLLLERAEIPGSKNLSGGRLYTHALAELLPQFHLTAPLERRITHESLSLLTPDGATTFSSLQPGGESWSVLRARFDPWLVAEAEKEGVECIPGATVDALYEENGRVCGVICGDDILRARYVVLAEGANSVLAERHGLVTRPAGEAMALGIKEVLSLETSAIEERFHLENNEGAALLFSGGICDDFPGGAFLYTNQQTLSLGIVCPLSSLTQSRVPASELLTRFKAHPAVRPLIKNTESLEYGAHLVPEGGLHSMPVQYAGNGWLLVGRCVAQLRQYRNFRARHGYGADWRTGGGTNADKRLPALRAAKSVSALSSQRRAQPAVGCSTALSACSGAFATPWLVSGVACVNAGYFPRFMGSG